MFPSLILVIINKERSIVNTFGVSTVLGGNVNGEGHVSGAEYRPATIGNLVFANTPTADSTIVDKEQPVLPRHSAVGPGSGDSHLA